jgi:hypothetical protein
MPSEATVLPIATAATPLPWPLSSTGPSFSMVSMGVPLIEPVMRIPSAKSHAAWTLALQA